MGHGLFLPTGVPLKKLKIISGCIHNGHCSGQRWKCDVLTGQCIRGLLISGKKIGGDLAVNSIIKPGIYAIGSLFSKIDES